MPQPSPRIRPFRAEDGASILSWIAESDPWRTLGTSQEAWRQRLDSLAADRAVDADVVEDDRGAAGIAIVRRGFLYGDYLQAIGIAPWARGRGLGTALLAHIETRGFSRGKNFYLCVSDFNEGARRFYRRLGYEEVGTLANLIIAGRGEV